MGTNPRKTRTNHISKRPVREEDIAAFQSKGPRRDRHGTKFCVASARPLGRSDRSAVSDRTQHAEGCKGDRRTRGWYEDGSWPRTFAEDVRCVEHVADQPYGSTRSVEGVVTTNVAGDVPEDVRPSSWFTGRFLKPS